MRPLIIGLLFLAGCSHAQIQVADGTLGPDGTWSAVVYEDQGVCLEIRATDREPNRLCDLRPDNAGLWQPGARGDRAKFVVVTTADSAAFAARIALANGGEARANFVSAPSLTELRFLVLELPARETPGQMEILDDEGAVLTTLELQ